ncbi:MAG: cell division protein FtsZ [Prevotella sp.]|jgi:cell division protein FtsZ|nr:cell division protein FtsZ [Prevotella sp.]
MSNELMDFVLPEKTPAIIKVVGVGGGGGNAVKNMFKQGIHGVSFALCNTDKQAMRDSDITTKLQLGPLTTKGLGAGNRPEIAKLAAEESKDDISRMFDDGTEMAFITAGMGGGTGTGAAAVVAGIAKSMGILTVGIVTIPFLFEGRRKIMQALAGVEAMSKNVDTLLVINNERLKSIYSDLDIDNAFAKADDTLTVAAKGISEIITTRGYINLDYADVKTILKDSGVAIMGTGYGEGEYRLEEALQDALNSPLLDNKDVFKSKKVLYNIYYSEEKKLIIDEMNAIDTFMNRFENDIEVIWGTSKVEGLGEKVKITLLATGFNMSDIGGIETDESKLSPEEREKLQQIEEQDEQRRLFFENQMQKYYGQTAIKQLGINPMASQPYIFSREELDDDLVAEAVENTPVFKRDKDFNPHEYKRNSKQPYGSLF